MCMCCCCLDRTANTRAGPPCGCLLPGRCMPHIYLRFLMVARLRGCAPSCVMGRTRALRTGLLLGVGSCVSYALLLGCVRSVPLPALAFLYSSLIALSFFFEGVVVASLLCSDLCDLCVCCLVGLRRRDLDRCLCLYCIVLCAE